MKIRRYREADREALTDVWFCSVKATHQFLSEEAIAQLLPFVRREAWNDMETWILESDDLKVAGFMSLSESCQRPTIAAGPARRPVSDAG